MYRNEDFMNNLPKDPVMLLSFVNMQLRDNYSSLTELCKTYMVDESSYHRQTHRISIMYTILRLTNLYNY